MIPQPFQSIEQRLGEDLARLLVDPDKKRLDCWFAVKEDLGPRENVLAALNV